MKKKQEKEQVCKRIDLPIVKKLEEASKVGFYVELNEDASLLEPMVRLCIEGLPAVPEEKLEAIPDVVLCPWTTVQTLTSMLQGVMLLHPVIIQAIKQRNGNAEKPKEE